MNQISHDSMSFQFLLQVIPDAQPQANQETMSQDISLMQNTWFEYTIPTTLFSDTEFNYQPIWQASSSMSGPLPPFLQFNPTNRTLFGYLNTTGIFRIDFTYSDDQGKQAFANIKLTITPTPKPPSVMAWHLTSISSIIALLTYMTYLLHFAMPVIQESSLTQHIEQASKRFQSIEDSKVTYIVPTDIKHLSKQSKRFKNLFKRDATQPTIQSTNYEFPTFENIHSLTTVTLNDQSEQQMQSQNFMSSFINVNDQSKSKDFLNRRLRTIAIDPNFKRVQHPKHSQF